MLDALREIDVETAAQRIEACRRAREPHSRQAQRVDKGTADRIPLQAGELGVQESKVKFGVVDDEPIRADETEELVYDPGKGRPAGKKFCRNSVHREGLFGHVSLGID